MSDTITIPFDPTRSPRLQIEAAVASVHPRPCARHPDELLRLDRAGTVENTLCDENRYAFLYNTTFDRCVGCPHNRGASDVQVKDCAVGALRFGNLDLCVRDGDGRPLPALCAHYRLQPDLIPRHHYESWVAGNVEMQCHLGNQSLKRCESHMKPSFESFDIHLRFENCLRCRLERLDVLPEEARASFENFIVEPPAIGQHLAICRAYAAAPKGVLLLLGGCGTGKTHLAVAIPA